MDTNGITFIIDECGCIYYYDSIELCDGVTLRGKFYDLKNGRFYGFTQNIVGFYSGDFKVLICAD